MRQIAVLPQAVVEQIAAGEVVERPASVVKELVENAIDAGATRIDVIVQQGGRELIRVVDNGCGIPADELAVALQRHATSKLRAFDDLYRLTTLGFRGEALSSIAAVSTFSITSRTAAQDCAERIHIAAGTQTKREQLGAPVGTTVEVLGLLENVPARHKFLKSAASETAHVHDVVQRFALAHDDIQFHLRSGKRVVLATTESLSTQARLAQILRGKVGQVVEGQREHGAIRVRAILGDPGDSLTTARHVFFFVAGRPFRDRALLHAIRLGYRELLPAGRYPLAVVFIDVADGTVDVNVHPQKWEVRFRDRNAVSTAVRHTVRDLLARAPWLAVAHLPGPAGATPAQPAAGSVLAAVDGASRATSAAAGLAVDGAPQASVSSLAADYAARMSQGLFGFGGAIAAEPVAYRTPARNPSRAHDGEAPAYNAAPAPRFSDLQYLGQLDRTYLLCERPGQFVMVDQHAAHERVIYERLRARSPDIAVQRLLFPVTIELPAQQLAAISESLGALRNVGFDIESFGDTAVVVREVPTMIQGDRALENVLTAAFDELADYDTAGPVEARLDKALATVACHAAVRAGDALQPAEVRGLLSDLDTIPFAAHCPHGRPVFVVDDVVAIARRFGRPG